MGTEQSKPNPAAGVSSKMEHYTDDDGGHVVVTERRASKPISAQTIPRTRLVAEANKLITELAETSLGGRELCRRLGEDPANIPEIAEKFYLEFGTAITQAVEARLRHDEIMAVLHRIDAQIPPNFD